MHKLFSVLTAAALCAALLAGCGDTGSAGNDANANASTATAAPNDDTMTATPSPAPADTEANADGGTAGTDDTSGTGDAGTQNGTGAAASGTAYSAEGLNKALGGILKVESGAAGGSLQTAQAAAALVEFAITCGTDSATLGADTKAWLDSLSEADRETLKANWADVCERARGISGDYDNNKGILADAGVTTDFAALDMSGADAFLNTVDSVLGI